ncbi:uncharacterized protein LOC123897535 isoform X2 [Trifolium pratense]|uniref:Uncharacterized protein n=4 Tax=Trifolium pratense TaxID=57577 RepID=A0ACB0L3Q5_TRIPR|nr:uncharacterized protein LOC123884291 isoform X2 [Trifolium pratense]XP_045804180.1 uncharacterized protein LOC123897535 isoform X2 [Trifolium pratense]XP_045804181.1 uncharacterized protein LOC123897535 isoform X2 [Trifolium pratense]CAJ2654544.1 unnamed protein product [Trifolium pratense]CAJ2663293.1 unnamed protein product [Trifolium pratense]
MMIGRSLYDFIVKGSFLPLKLRRPLIMQYEISDEFLKFFDQNKTTELRQEAERSTPQAARIILKWHLNLYSGHGTRLHDLTWCGVRKYSTLLDYIILFGEKKIVRKNQEQYK